MPKNEKTAVKNILLPCILLYIVSKYLHTCLPMLLMLPLIYYYQQGKSVSSQSQQGVPGFKLDIVYSKKDSYMVSPLVLGDAERLDVGKKLLDGTALSAGA